MPKWILLAALIAACGCERDRGTEERPGTEGAVGAERDGQMQQQTPGTTGEQQAPGTGEMGGQQAPGQEQQMGVGTEADRQLTQQVRQKLKEADLPPSAQNADVNVQDGRATLRGKVGSSQESDQVEKIVSEIPGVKEVDNQLQVEAP